MDICYPAGTTMPATPSESACGSRTSSSSWTRSGSRSRRRRPCDSSSRRRCPRSSPTSRSLYVRLGRLALSRRERGQVVVVFALALPMILGIGSIVVTIGNWYVHKKHLQTLVDAGAFASGQEFTGCFQDPTDTNDHVRRGAQVRRRPEPRRDDGEPAARGSPGRARRAQQHDVLDGEPLPGRLHARRTPCAVKFLDVKATEDKFPLLFKWLPAIPSPKSKARIEIHKCSVSTGLSPWPFPRSSRTRWPRSSSTRTPTRSSGVRTSTPRASPGLSAFNVYQGDVGGGSSVSQGTYDIVIVSSRDPSFVAPDERAARVRLQREPNSDDLLRQAVEPHRATASTRSGRIQAARPAAMATRRRRSRKWSSPGGCADRPLEAPTSTSMRDARSPCRAHQVPITAAIPSPFPSAPRPGSTATR